MSDPFQLVGTTIAGKYRIDRVIGEGGFGVVYGGFHLVVGEPIAVKAMKPLGGTAAHQQRATELFLREARVLFGLTHPSIVRLYDVGALPSAFGAVPYVVLELLSGVSLEQEIARRIQGRLPAFSAEELGRVFEPVFEAVAFAHERGVTHRDLKPSNVMLVQGPTAKVVDFGIARVTGAETTTGGAPFTPRYAAPEQWDPTVGTVSALTDIFALGLMLSEACTFRPAVTGDGPAQILASVMDPSKRPAVWTARPDLPRAIDGVIARATRVRPEERYRSVREMQQAFRAALGGSVASVPPPALAPMLSPAAHTTMPAAVTPQIAPRTGGGIVLGVVGILAVAGLAALGLVLFFLERARAKPLPMATPTATATTTTAPPAPPPPPATVEDAGVPPAVVDAGKKPIVDASAPAVADASAPKKASSVMLLSCNGGEPFWTKGEIVDVLNTHIGEVAGCNGNAGLADVTFVPDETGKLRHTSCSMRKDRSPEALSTCLCIDGKASRWSFPPSHGTLGLLKAGSFICTYKLSP